MGGDEEPFRGGISIHALLAESDRARLTYWTRTEYFYPRSPCGERREPTALRTPHQRFLSTLSLRRATLPGRLGFLNFPFLSTLSLRRATEGDNQH